MSLLEESNDLIEVTLLDGSTELVTRSEANTMEDNNELLIPDNDGLGLTISNVYGPDYE